MAPFGSSLAPAVSILVSFGPSWLHMSVGFVLQPTLSPSSVPPLELSLQPQPHFHSLARPPNLRFLGSHLEVNFASSGFLIPPIDPFLGAFGSHLQLILRPLAF